MTKQERFDRFYLEMALNTANFSYCIRKKVGCVIVKDDVIVLGYNGTPSGMPNVCEGPDGETEWYVFHAESNALSKVMTSSISSKGATMYNTFSPCINCAKLIIQAKIARYVYIDTHSDTRGLDLMRQCGVIVEHMPMQ